MNIYVYLTLFDGTGLLEVSVKFWRIYLFNTFTRFWAVEPRGRFNKSLE